jgi:hypothetical protein
VPRRSEDDAGAIGDASRGVRRQIVAAQVRFRFDDPAGGFTVYQDLAQQRARYLDGRAVVERPRQDGACFKPAGL